MTCYVWLAWAGQALGADYEVELEAGSEQALLLPEEAVDEDLAGTVVEASGALMELRQGGVDLATASREALYALPGLTWAQVDAVLAYRQRAGGLRSLAELVEAGVLTEAELRRLQPFLSRRGEGSPVLSGRVRLLAAQGVADSTVPPALLHARLRGLGGWSAGAVTALTRRRLGPVRYDGRRRALVSPMPGPALHLPKLYVQWESAQASVLVGSYRLGFGQRLVLDTTGRPAPHGPLPDEGFSPPGPPERGCLLAGAERACQSYPRRATGDFGWSEGFRGVAGTLRLPVGGTTLALAGFGSWQSRGVLQSELVERSSCSSASVARECKSPEVLLAGGATGTERFVGRTLPGGLQELAAGGNLTLALSSRTRLGLTGWGASLSGGLQGVALELKEQSRYPPGGSAGAVGLEAAWGEGPWDVALEVARSLGARGSGLGAVQRTVLSQRHQELELVLRYYDRDFDNPYARAPSAPDEFEGLRARNELGARARYLLRLPDALTLRGQVDLWALPSESATPAGTTHLQASARVDLPLLPGLQPSVWAEHRNKDLGRNAPGECLEGADCAGERYRLGVGVRVGAGEALQLTALYQHGWAGSERHPEGFQQEGRATLELRCRPLSELRLRGRVSWQDEDLSEGSRAAQGLRAAAEVAWAPLEALAVRTRYELLLDLREATGARTPPEPPWHLLRLELEARF